MQIDIQQVFGNLLVLVILAGVGYLIYSRMMGKGVTFSFEFVKGLFRRH